MKRSCPYCSDKDCPSDPRTVIRSGFFKRKSDRKLIPRYKCLVCKKTFSSATFDPCYRQQKRFVNEKLFDLFASGNSQRRISYILELNRKTVKRKFLYLGFQAHLQLKLFNRNFAKAENIQFDDLETFEHTKCKPLSVTLAVEEKTRRILGFAVSRMPAKGRLANTSIKKYGKRKDERAQGRENLFLELQDIVASTAIIKSDQNPHYPKDVKRFFPESIHLTTKGGRGSLGGQGELKKLGFDPIFSLNHTCAKLRADINRLIRKTWSTTNNPDRLKLHLAITALYHNQHLLLRKRV